jgi:hypothetical protein
MFQCKFYFQKKSDVCFLYRRVFSLSNQNYDTGFILKPPGPGNVSRASENQNSGDVPAIFLTGKAIRGTVAESGSISKV